jgi:hypothetical protein
MSNVHSAIQSDPHARALPRWVVAVLLVFVVAAYAALARLRHGSWEAAATASLAPMFFAIGLTILWTFEHVRGRPLHRPAAFVTLVLFGVAAGGTASALAPSLGSVAAGMFGGFFWGTIVAFGWTRPSTRTPSMR